jgi:hypothetical protein
MQNVLEIEMLERELHRTRLRYAEVKERALLSDGAAPTEDEAILHKIEQDWKELLGRLHQARQRARDKASARRS